MTFGVKVRKVQMMRGGRQGNNAFVEDPIHTHQTPIDYLMNDEYCLEKIFATDFVSRDSLNVLLKIIGNEKFTAFIDKALPIILR